MKPLSWHVIVLCATVMAPLTAARADLCGKCKGKAYIASVGKCAACGGFTGSGAHKICRKCSKKLGQCEHCRTPPAGAEKPKPPAVKIVTPPGTGTVSLSQKDSGKALRIAVGRKIVVTLKGNPTTGYSWSLRQIQGPAVRMVGKPKYTPRPAHPDMAGAGGAFAFTFVGARAGTSAVTLVYARPWEKGKAPAETFTMTVHVGAGGKPSASPDRKRRTGARAKALLASTPNFACHVQYFDEEGKPYYSLLLLGAKPKTPKPPLTVKRHRLTAYASKPQVQKIIQHLAASGYLADAKDAMQDPIDPATGPCYLLRITGGPPDGLLDLRGSLGWGKDMAAKLDALRRVLLGTPAEGMDKLLKPLEEFRK